jgi:fumarate hydratase class II
MADHLIERDSPLYGPQTELALKNFPISGVRFQRPFIRALSLIKGAAAEVNAGLGLLDPEIAKAIGQAADEAAQGLWDGHFPLDIFQTGSGTSTNMNANEVIAKRASQIPGDKLTVHPNDHVNMGQSSNDVIPAAIHVSAYMQINELLMPSLAHMRETLKERQTELKAVIKTGRTHLMDAMPISMAQEISGWAHQICQGIERIESCLPRLSMLAIGGTAVGTGINTHKDFGRMVAERLAVLTGLPFKETENHFASQAAMDTALELSGHLKTLATALIKISNDLRLMNSGPNSGFAEISLPKLQPGSSIMPGKTNPVLCEAMMMVCAQVIGNDAAITVCNQHGNFELNAMMPLIAHNLLQEIFIMGNGIRAFTDKAVAGFEINEKKIKEKLELNPILVTTLAPIIGYDRAAEIAQKAYEDGRPIKEVAQEMTGLPMETIARLLNPSAMLEGGIINPPEKDVG